MLIPVSVPGGTFLQSDIVRKAAAAQSTAAIFCASLAKRLTALRAELGRMGRVIRRPTTLAVSIPGAAEAPILCDTEDIDLVLMDVQTEHRENGLAAAKKIREAHPAIKIVVATSLIDTQVLARAKAVGADSLWYKDGDEGTLMQVVRRTMAGEHIFPDAPPSVEIGTAMSAEFTKGEMKVLRCLVRGLSYNEIAKELDIEPSTVKFHVINMLQKTNLENKLQLAIAATEAKLVVELSDT